MVYYGKDLKEVDLMLLENKIAIVTGGSRGIGFATVEAFIKEENAKESKEVDELVSYTYGQKRR